MEPLSTSSSFILEEKVTELENRLSHSNNALRTKEHVVRLQQDQIKKLEDMYKKALEEIAVLNGENKRTIGDMENLRIILKSFENARKANRDFESQVDLIPPPCTETKNDVHQQTETHLINIRESLSNQSNKIEQIDDLLRHSTCEQLDIIQQNIHDLEKQTEDILSKVMPAKLNIMSLYSSQLCRTMSPISEEREEWMLMENSSQTIVLTTDTSVSVNVESSCVTVQAEAALSHVACSTSATSENASAQCCLVEYADFYGQNSLVDDFATLKSRLDDVEHALGTSEELYKTLEDSLVTGSKLIDVVSMRNEEIEEAHACVDILASLIDRTSVLTARDVKELCKEVTVQTGDQYGLLMRENVELKASNDMLRHEIGDLKSSNSEFPRLVVELVSNDSQTDLDLMPDHRQQLVDLSFELSEAYQTIKALKSKLETVERESHALEDIKDLFLRMTTETSQLYKEQLNSLRENHEREKVSNKRDSKTCSTQIYGWAGIIESTEVMRRENEQLINTVIQLRAEIAAEKDNQSNVAELQELVMILSFQQDENERKLVKEVSDKISSSYEIEIGDMREEIRTLRQDNELLSDGVEQLRALVNISAETNSFTDVTSASRIELKSVDSCTTVNCVEQLKSLCQSLVENLKQKKANFEDRFELMVSLEKDLRTLMKEFMDYKWSSQNEHQRLMIRHSDLLTQNEELINCLGQYKSINENLLRAHYDLERAKTCISHEHQNLLQDYLKLQEKLNAKVLGVERSMNTILFGSDLSDADLLKIENISLKKENGKLRKEVDNLLAQLNKEHLECLKSLQVGKTCAQCQEALETVKKLNVELNLLNSASVIKEHEIVELQEQLQRSKDLNGENDDLRRAVDSLNSQCKEMREELREGENLRRRTEQENVKYREEIRMYQSAIEKIATIKEKYFELEVEVRTLRAELSQKDHVLKTNATMTEELQHFESQLKTATDIKDKVQADFDNYVRTNSLLQQTLSTQNGNLAEEVKELQDKNQDLEEQLARMVLTQTSSKTELLRVVNECANYKLQLESMAKRIDAHLKEHLEFKNAADDVKRDMQAEIEKLRRLLEYQNVSVDEINVADCSAEKLRTFISAKEIEIDCLMGQKLQAMAALGQMNPCKQRTSDEFKVHLQLRKNSRDLSAGRPSRSSQSKHDPGTHCRSASIPRMSKSAKKVLAPLNPDLPVRQAGSKKTGGHNQVTKRK